MLEIELTGHEVGTTDVVGSWTPPGSWRGASSIDCGLVCAPREDARVCLHCLSLCVFLSPLTRDGMAFLAKGARDAPDASRMPEEALGSGTTTALVTKGRLRVKTLYNGGVVDAEKVEEYD